VPDIRDSNSNKEWNSDRLRRHTDRQLDVYRCMWKDDQRIKSDYGNTGSTASDDSTCGYYHCVRSDTSSIDTNIYKWTYGIVPCNRDVQYLYFLSSAWTMRRNDYRDMDSDGCVRKSACTGNKNDHS
jgi:hypothetical protein